MNRTRSASRLDAARHGLMAENELSSSGAGRGPSEMSSRSKDTHTAAQQKVVQYERTYLKLLSVIGHYRSSSTHPLFLY